MIMMMMFIFMMMMMMMIKKNLATSLKASKMNIKLFQSHFEVLSKQMSNLPRLSQKNALYLVKVML
jgi:hypothetical protein